MRHETDYDFEANMNQKVRHCLKKYNENNQDSLNGASWSEDDKNRNRQLVCYPTKCDPLAALQ